MRDRFWELPLGDLSREEWEALCDGCGQCCLHKLEDDETGEIAHTNVACKLLDTRSARCSDYRHRKAFVPDCLRLTPRLVDQVSWLPDSCAYRLRAAGKPLAEWHHLICGDPAAVHRRGPGVAGRVVSETDAGPLEHHIVEWIDDDDATGEAA
ncbi:YcgN family cysteine cluster protein [Tsuneonella sp. SYSU-LHT278]|uniref:YcgN family cysteine cluster protein n=1 Tax=Tsuneonella sediminis TaxID=3416089 RepID=UPI003F790E86